MEARPVDDPRDDFLHVERLSDVDGRDAEKLLRVVERLFDGSAPRRTQLLPVQLRHDLSPQSDRVALVRGQVVRYARDAAVHLGAAQLLLGAVFVDRHLHQRRPAEEYLRPLLHHHHVVRHAGYVGAAGRGRAEDQADGGNALGGAAGDLAEATSARHEDLRLERQVRPSGFGEVDDRHAVLLADLHGADALGQAVGIEAATPHRRFVGGDHALDAGDHADARDDASPQVEIRPPGRERHQLEKRRIAVEQQLDALARHQLAPPDVPLHVLLAAAGAHQLELFVQECDLLEKPGPILPVGLRARVGVASKDLHLPQLLLRVRTSWRDSAS